MTRLLEDCVAKSEAIVLNDVGIPVEDFEELLRRGLEEGCSPLDIVCHVAVEAYRECMTGPKAFVRPLIDCIDC